LFDFAQPIAVLAVAVLHFIPDSDDPAAIISRIADAQVSGSYLVVSHVGPDDTPEGRAAQDKALKLYERTPTPVIIRDPAELAALIDERYEIVEPGLVGAPDWRPEPDASDDPPQPTALVAVARKR
jgi:hypothetical protein